MQKSKPILVSKTAFAAVALLAVYLVNRFMPGLLPADTDQALLIAGPLLMLVLRLITKEEVRVLPERKGKPSSAPPQA